MQCEAAEFRKSPRFRLGISYQVFIPDEEDAAAQPVLVAPPRLHHREIELPVGLGEGVDVTASGRQDAVHAAAPVPLADLDHRLARVPGIPPPNTQDSL